MQLQHISKSKFKASALNYMRLVESHKTPLIITHFGKPVIKIEPYSPPVDNDPYAFFKDSVLQYVRPNDPVDPQEWGALK